LAELTAPAAITTSIGLLPLDQQSYHENWEVHGAIHLASLKVSKKQDT